MRQNKQETHFVIIIDPQTNDILAEYVITESDWWQARKRAVEKYYEENGKDIPAFFHDSCMID